MTTLSSKVDRPRGAIPSRPAGGKTVTRIKAILDGKEWTFHFDPIYEELLLAPVVAGLDAHFLQELETLVAARRRGLYRYPLTFRTVPLLIQIDPRSSEIGVFSWRGQAELFLEDITDDADYEAHVRGLKNAAAEDAPVDLDILAKKYRLPTFDSEEFQSVYERTLENEDEIIALVKGYRPSFMERLTDFSLDLTARYVMVRNHLLKFIAILPSLDHDRSGREVKRIFLEAIRRIEAENESLRTRKQEGREPFPPRYMKPLQWLGALVRVSPASLTAWAIRRGVRFMARRFIAGETIESATQSLRTLRASGREATLDQLGELVVSEKEADGYKAKVLELIRGFSRYIPEGQRNGAGIYSAHVSIKVTALASQFVPEAFDFTFGMVAPRLREILLEAKKHKVFINIDAEHYHVRDQVFEIYRRVLLETPELRGYDGTGIVVQAYLRDGAAHLEEVIALAKERGVSMPVRLVKGAYWDAETIEAEVHAFKAPQFLNKVETDIYFRQLVHRIFESYPHVKLCLASHNVFDHAFGEALRSEKFPHLPPFEHQCLHMTYEGLSTALAAWGVPTRNYVPVGSLLVGMAYLVRRIMENSSQVGFLTQMRNEHFEKVLIPSQILDGMRAGGQLAKDLSRTPTVQFENVTPVRLYLRGERKTFFQVLDQFRAEMLGCEYPNRFEVKGELVEVRSPSKPEVLVGRIRYATAADATRAVDALAGEDARRLWSRLPVERRAEVLVRAAQIMTLRRLELAALIVCEAGKGLREALADVDEAIDFLALYAREEVRLARRMKGVSPRGVTAVISPWNFPLAIPCGMVSAALVAGNPVVLKSAEQAPLIAQVLVDLLHEAGVPEEALIHLPGLGEEVGARLVEDPRVAAIVFTGSKAVGTWIAKTAGKRTVDGLPVRVITEMGGKNAIIVTSSAELDETVAGTLYSAFAHAGQKCSALSRVLVDESVKESFIQRFSEAARDIRVGEAWDPATYMNPVITSLDQERLRRTAREAIEEAERRGGRVLVDRSHDPLPGYAVGPVVIELPADAMWDDESLCRREHFGPIVHVIPYRGLDEAVRLFNSVEYALTGGVFSQSQDDIDRLIAEIEAGNLYVNRTCTGARVAIEPFGGFKLSGTGPKAGQSHYLVAFHRMDRKTDLGGTISYGHRERFVEEHRSAAALAALEEADEAEMLALVDAGGEGRTHALWRDFVRWSVRHLAAWVRNGEPNRRIPGQISLDDFRLPRRQGVLVVSRKRMDYSSWQTLLGGLLLGMRFGVWLEGCDPNREREAWRKFVARVSSLGLDIRLLAEGGEEFIQGAETFVLDLGSEEALQTWLARIYDSPTYASSANPWMPQVLTPGDGPHVRDYPGLYRRLCAVRSLAINTMRHGAPLD